MLIYGGVANIARYINGNSPANGLKSHFQMIVGVVCVNILQNTTRMWYAHALT